MKLSTRVVEYSIKVVFLLLVCALGYAPLFGQWEPDVRLTNDPAISATSFGNAWCVAASGDTVHVVWYDYRDAGSPYGEIYYKRSSDGGVIWGSETRLTYDDSTSHFPCVAATSSFCHVVWEDTRDGNSEIYSKYSSDGGLTWGTDTRLTNDSAASGNPSMAVSGSYVHAVWNDSRSGGSDIFYNRSTDNGMTWGSDKQLSDFQSSNLASVAAFGNNVHVVWDDSRYGNSDIFYRHSTDAGLSWEPEVQLTADPNQQTWPCVAARSFNVHVVWGDNRDAPNVEIYYKRSTDNGVTWGSDTRLTISPNSFYPCLAASGTNVHVTWRDVRGGPRIYYKVSTDNGNTWSPDTALPSVNVIQLYPSIAASGTIVHVVWWDQRNGPSGNVEVYYKRNPAGNLGIEEKYEIAKSIESPKNLFTNIFRGPLVLPAGKKCRVLDITERVVEPSRMQPGVYFVEIDGKIVQKTVKVR